MAFYTDYDPEQVRMVDPVHDELVYCGRIDDTVPDAPVFVQPGSFVRISFSGSSWVKAVVINKRRWSDSWIGALADDKQYKILLEKNGEPEVVTLTEGLEKDTIHDVTLFKRMDQCHEYTFLGFLMEYGARVEKARRLPRKKLEFYGDSITDGGVAEALDYVRRPDPEHNGEYNNAYFSFAWATARKLHAQAHIVAQGGIALMDGTGYYENRNGKAGMESCFDKVYFYPADEFQTEDKQKKTVQEKDTIGLPALQRMEKWNFARYTPHVVVVSIGQNDAWPEDFMREDFYGEKAQEWRNHYKNWILSLREIYPQAWIVLTTSPLYHHPGWDRSIGRVCTELNDPRIVHFLFEETGRGTPGHVRVPEAMTMALELSGFIEGLSDRLWD